MTTASKTLRIGVDLGGTKIEAIALDLEGGVRATRRAPTPQGDYQGGIRAIVDLVAAVEAEAGAPAGGAPVGLGMPGAISPASGLVKNANSTWLNGRPFRADLAAALARPLRIANDADCFAVSEAADGAAAGAQCVFGVILGTGVGGGVVIGGRPLAGPNAIAGEWGHTPLPNPRDDERPGPACYCGRRGCVETWCSGPGLARDHAARGGGAPLSAPPLTAAEIAARAEAGDVAAAASLARHAERLGRALSVVVNVIDPHVIVLGGGLSNIAGLPAAVEAALRPHVFSDSVATRVVRHRHGDSSGVRGAAWLWAPAELAAQDPRHSSVSLG